MAKDILIATVIALGLSFVGFSLIYMLIQDLKLEKHPLLSWYINSINRFVRVFKVEQKEKTK